MIRKNNIKMLLFQDTPPLCLQTELVTYHLQGWLLHPLFLAFINLQYIRLTVKTMMMKVLYETKSKHDGFTIFCSSETFIAKEDKDIRLVQQQTKHLCKCKYVE